MKGRAQPVGSYGQGERDFILGILGNQQRVLNRGVAEYDLLKFFKIIFIYLYFWPCCAAWILVSPAGIQLMPLALRT